MVPGIGSTQTLQNAYDQNKHQEKSNASKRRHLNFMGAAMIDFFY